MRNDIARRGAGRHGVNDGGRREEQQHGLVVRGTGPVVKTTSLEGALSRPAVP